MCLEQAYNCSLQSHLPRLNSDHMFLSKESNRLRHKELNDLKYEHSLHNCCVTSAQFRVGIHKPIEDKKLICAHF